MALPSRTVAFRKQLRSCFFAKQQPNPKRPGLHRYIITNIDTIMRSLLRLMHHQHKAIAMTLSCVLAVATLYAQAKGDSTKRCFPSGSSLNGASIQNDRILQLNDVNDIRRFFDLSTGSIVAKWVGSEPCPREDLYMPLRKPVYAEKSRYNDKEFLVVDSNGVKIYSCPRLKESRDHIFEENTGTLLMSEDRDLYVYRPGADVFKIRLNKDDKYITYNARISPDGKWAITSLGSLINLYTGKIQKKAFPGYDGSRRHRIAFNRLNGTFTLPLDTNGIAIYDVATGRLKEARPIPSALPRIQGFETLLLSNGSDYVYWMYFPPKVAILVAGLAYYVKDGVGLSLCDPEWEREHNENFITALKRVAKRMEEEKQEKAIAAEAERKASYERYLRIQANPGSRTSVGHDSSPMEVVCQYCHGEGKIYYERLAVGGGLSSGGSTLYSSVNQYGRKTYSSSNGTGSVKCSACSGSGKVRVSSW